MISQLRAVYQHLDEMKEVGYREMANTLNNSKGRIKKILNWGCNYSTPPLKLHPSHMKIFNKLDLEITRLYNRRLLDFVNTYCNPPELRINRYNSKPINLVNWLHQSDPIAIFNLEYAEYCRVTILRRQRYCRQVIRGITYGSEWGYYYGLLVKNVGAAAKEWLGESIKSNN